LLGRLDVDAPFAVWPGIITSISPCPLINNIALISYVGRKVDAPEIVFLHGLMYIFGRTLGVLLVGSLLSTPSHSYFFPEIYAYGARASHDPGGNDSPGADLVQPYTLLDIFFITF